jgi:phage tail-like protein
MASVVAQPRNALRTYQFRVGVLSDAAAPATYVAGVRSVSGLRAQVSPWETWEGGNNLHRYANPNKVTWEPVTLEQGLALDDTFERWAQAVLDFAAGIPPKEPVKRQVLIDVWDENAYYPAGPPAAGPAPALGTTVAIPAAARLRRYHLHNAWVSRYQPLAKLDALTSEVMFLAVELVHEGWVRGAVQ